MRLPPYPRYKPSGIDWLGDVPEHWALKRLKLVVQLSDRKIDADEENQRVAVPCELVAA
jgi:type I restriction enzyme S subunit